MFCKKCHAEAAAVEKELLDAGCKDRNFIDALMALAKCNDHRRK